MFVLNVSVFIKEIVFAHHRYMHKRIFLNWHPFDIMIVFPTSQSPPFIIKLLIDLQYQSYFYFCM